MNRFLKTHLHILQLEEYTPKRFLKWWSSHPFTFSLSQKKPLVMTPKALMLLRITYLLYLFLFLPTLIIPYFFIALIILFIEPFPLLFLSLLIIKPYEIINRRRTVMLVSQQVKSLPHLTVIGITGSYGKTSTKDFLYQILRQYKQTVKTPQSYNTVFGVSKVVDLELYDKTKYFICEMGAYVRGEIKELVSMAHPKYAILTAIGSQHLERFKSLKNTTLAKFELIDAVEPNNALANLDNEFIASQLHLPQYKGVHTYSIKDSSADFYISSFTLSPTGTKFSLKHKAKILDFSSPLFGTANLQNLIAAISMALLLEVPYEHIKHAVENLSPSPHRLELKSMGTATLIDNAYSSNEIGFTQVIADLKNLKGKKAILTPGIIELGDETKSIHTKLGRQLADTFDSVYLIGHSDRTAALESGISSMKSTSEIKYLSNHSQLWPTIELLAKTHDWILLENDLPDNY